MRKEDVVPIAQILTGMKDAVNRLEKAEKSGDKEDIMRYKKEILSLHEEINKLI